MKLKSKVSAQLVLDPENDKKEIRILEKLVTKCKGFIPAIRFLLNYYDEKEKQNGDQ